MTETSGVTVANFIAGILVLLVALALIPSIVRNQVTSAEEATIAREFQYITGAINSTCGTTAERTLTPSLPNEAKVIFQNDEVRLEAEETTKQVKVECSLQGSRQKRAGTFPITFRGKPDGGYEIV
ncbi:MAG: hypothetical protein ABEJ83_05410 [Candidatus Nanohaloarchaea archaeon]